MFVRTTAINKILALKKFVKGVQGGTSAGKTFGIIPIMIDIATKEKGCDMSIVAESIPHLKRGAIKDFKKIMQSTGRWFDERWNATDFKYTFANGSMIEFFSADSDSKLRGARRDYLYMNECNNTSFHSYMELVSRTKKGVWLDWNPVNEFWFHSELMHDNDVDFLIINYLDNEACPESALNFILKAKEKAKTSTYWENWYRVYGLGEIGSLEGVIFNNWSQIDSIPKDAVYIGTGLDFGFTNDPTVAIDAYKYNGQVILDEVIYNTGLLNRVVYNRLKDKPRKVVADGSEPRSISELRTYGLSVLAADRKISILDGIAIMQGLDMLVTSSSVNLIKELRNYMWEKDKAGKSLNEPIGTMNHAMDACRYILSNTFSNPNKGRYVVMSV